MSVSHRPLSCNGFPATTILDQHETWCAMPFSVNTRGIARIVMPAAGGVREKHLGMAFVVDNRRVMTCCHVVNDALGRDLLDPEQPPPDTQIAIRFPYANHARGVGTEVVKWGLARPWQRDVAVLQLQEDAPSAAGVAIFSDAEARLTKWHCIGWDQKGYEREAEGEFGSVLSRGEHQLNGRPGVTVPIVPGYSGAVLWSDTLAAFVGMVVTKDREHFESGLLAYAIPTYVLLEVWPGLPLAKNEALRALARAEWAAIRDRTRFRPARLANETLAPDLNNLTDLLDAVHVPIRVWASVIPQPAEKPLGAEKPASRGTDDDSESEETEDRPDPRYVPAGEQPDPHEKENGADEAPFDEVFDRWRKAEFGSLAGIFRDCRGASGRAMVVLGDPGYGKSWLSAMLSLRLLKEGLGGGWVAVRVTCKELGERLSTARNVGAAVLAAAVARLSANHAGRDSLLVPALESSLGDALAAGRVLLVADGWDEAPDYQAAVRSGLEMWAGPMVVTSRLVGHNPSFLPNAPRLRLAPLTDDGAATLIDRWFGPDSITARQLRQELQGAPQLGQLMRVPLLAVIVCALREKQRLTPLPPGRTALLDEAVNDLLWHHSRDPRPGVPDSISADPIDSGLVNDVRRVVAELARKTFTGERWMPPRDQLLATVRESAEARDLGTARRVIDALTGASVCSPRPLMEDSRSSTSPSPNCLRPAGLSVPSAARPTPPV